MSRQIALTQGQVAIVDDEDYERISKFKWYAIKTSNGAGFYAVRNSLKGEFPTKQQVRMHRFVLGLVQGDGLEVDHIEPSATLDNRRSNLRLATREQNMQNARRVGSSGYRGVTRSYGRWQAQIQINKKHTHLGRFDTPQEAHAAYCKAAKEHFGEFARTA